MRRPPQKLVGITTIRPNARRTISRATSTPQGDHVTLTHAETVELTKTISGYDLDAIAKKLTHAITRDRRGGSAQPDGYGRGRGNDGPGSGAKITVDDENGDPDTVDVTGVELAVLNRDKPVHDQHHDKTEAAIAQARRCIDALDRLDGLLLGIDKLALGDDLTATPPEPGCSSCSRYADAVGRPHWSPRFRGDLCRWCYGWVNDAETNPKRQLPPLTLIARVARGERITKAMAVAATG